MRLVIIYSIASSKTLRSLAKRDCFRQSVSTHCAPVNRPCRIRGLTHVDGSRCSATSHLHQFGRTFVISFGLSNAPYTDSGRCRPSSPLRDRCVDRCLDGTSIVLHAKSRRSRSVLRGSCAANIRNCHFGLGEVGDLIVRRIADPAMAH